MDNLIGKKLDGRYQLEELIGSGGMANVYKATDLLENRLVAVKILREECRGNEDLVRRFKNESKAISVLDHPNIVKVYDVSVTDKLQFIVMEYIDGITLKEYMEYRAQPLTYKETLHFITQVLAALQHAHEKGIVHRDIKPQNIMLLADSTIKVMDFGIARFSRSENQTMTDKAIGSVHYISPEQAKGDTTDAKADIYSVGVMMYEMLSGKLPFESDSPVSVAIKQIADTATPLRELNPAVPEALAAITERAMAKEPRERYPSAQAMLANIDEFKRNPSVKFEYQYLTDTAPTRYIDKVVNKTATKQSGGQQRPRTGARPAARGGTKTKKRLALPILAGMAAAFLIGAAILVFLIFKYEGNGMFSQSMDVDLPNFIGLTQAEIQEKYPDSKFIFQTEEEYNTEYAAGVVCDQYPRAQTASDPKRVKENAKITLTISRGVEIVTMPDLSGMSRAEALNACKEKGLMPTFKTETVPKGQASGVVLRTDPVSGTQVEANTENSSVTVYISQEEVDKSTTVPNLVGVASLSEAQDLIRSAKLVLGGYSEEYSDTVPAGAVISQNPVSGTPAKWNDPVSIVVSKGAQERTIYVHIAVDETNEGGTYTLLLNGGNPQPWSPTAGQASSYQWSVTSTGTGTITLQKPDGTTAEQAVDFAPGGSGDLDFGTFGGNYKKPDDPSSTPPDPSQSAPSGEGD